MYKNVTLKKGKDIPIKKKHHWIFSGAIDKSDKFEDGEIMRVFGFDGEQLGYAYFNNKTTICGRMISFGYIDPLESIKINIESAIKMRMEFFKLEKTNCFRIINGEGDFLPGLVADYYNQIIVIQISTIGIDKLKTFLIKCLIDTFKNDFGIEIKCIYEKSLMGARRQDGLKEFEGVLFGEIDQRIEVSENGVIFSIDIKKSQKTGLFLDQRCMRQLVGELSETKKVLNCFSYTGGFSLYSAIGGAKNVTSIDISSEAIENAKLNFQLNGFDPNRFEFKVQDVFEYLKSERELNYELVILDPPAFAKKREDIPNAQKAYFEINKLAFRKMPSSSILLTCSCSYHVQQEAFEEIISKSAKEAKRSIKIIQRHRIASDHPININQREIDYLKCLMVYIT